ncbi:MAG: hypothetical protein P9L89_05420 [Candidatus Celaenobacter polaris]|nr:hypothetical protein [Candidatus Celaenobacter polaris]
MRKKKIIKSKKTSPKGTKNSGSSSIKFRGKHFRLLAFQPLSLAIELSCPFELSIQDIICRFALRPAHSEKSSQLTHGGTNIVIEFSTKENTDLLPATQKGLDLIEDFLSALSLVEGASFRTVEPVQIISTDQTVSQKHTLVHFLNLSMNHWHKPISQETFRSIQSILAHWDGLENGKRLRRAARQFQKAIGTDDALMAFQHAYMGLEAIDKPLADTMGIPAGVEEIEGHCEKCGEKYIRKRTVLSGVRAYVAGAIHPEAFVPEKKKEWKEINDLRHKIFHSLQDSKKLEQKVRSVLPAAMHHLHDAVCCLSHSHDLESDEFKLVRGMNRLIFIGEFKAVELDPLEECQPLLDTEQGYWVPHPKFGFVPRFKIQSPGLDDFQGIFCWLNESLRNATKENLVPANFEDNQDHHSP